MTGQVSYSFTILRYVHDVVAGESLNVGVVLHDSTGARLLVRTQKSVARLRQTFSGIDPTAFRGMMSSIERGVSLLAKELAAEPFTGRDLDVLKCVRRVLPDDDSALQWSAAGWGLTGDVSETMDHLFERYVTRYDKATVKEGRHRTDDDIRREFMKRLDDSGTKIPFEKKHVRGDQDEITFDTAWKNGSWHAYEPISFDLVDEDRIKDKARRWRGHLSAVKIGSTDEVKLHFLTGGPRDEKLKGAYEKAKTILLGSPFAAALTEETDTDRLVRKITTEFLSSVQHNDREPAT